MVRFDFLVPFVGFFFVNFVLVPMPRVARKAKHKVHKGRNTKFAEHEGS
jgi:hypothetical protein